MPRRDLCCRAAAATAAAAAAIDAAAAAGASAAQPPALLVLTGLNVHAAGCSLQDLHGTIHRWRTAEDSLFLVNQLEQLFDSLLVSW